MKVRGTVIALVVAVLLVGVVRQIATGARAMEMADRATHDGETRRAVEGARAAAEALLPGSPYPRRGMERLAQIGRDAEARGDFATAGIAYRAMRAAAEETRAIGSANAVWTSEANEGLSRLAAKETPAQAIDVPLAAETGPSPVELLLVGLVPFALYAGAVTFLRRRRAA